MGPEEPGRRPPHDRRSRSDRERDLLAELAELSAHEGFAAPPAEPAAPQEPGRGEAPEGPAEHHDGR